jgi:hypothetical protein
MGWRDRTFLAARERWERIGIGGGMLLPCVVRDGVAVGTWKLQRRGGHATVSVEEFEPLDAATRAAIDEEIVDIARFEGLRLSHS